jgi:hypothetical protein
VNRIVTGFDESGSPAIIAQGEPPAVIHAGRYTTTELWVSGAGPLSAGVTDTSTGEWAPAERQSTRRRCAGTGQRHSLTAPIAAAAGPTTLPGGAGPMRHFTMSGTSAPKPPAATPVTRALDAFSSTV